MTAGPLLARVLAAAGTGAAYGRPLDGLPVTEVRDPVVAVLLAHAHRAVHGVPAAAHLGDGTLVVPGLSPAGGPDPTLPSATVVAEDAAALAALPPVLAQGAQGEGVRVEVRVDPGVPWGAGTIATPSPAAAWVEPDDEVVEEVARAGHVVVLVGPGVVARRAVGGLRAVAAAGRLGVLNTWGAKGVFHWQSRHHWATVGLQARDFELGGLAEADLVLAVGVDEREAPRRLWAPGSRPAVRVVPAEALGPLAERWPRAPGAFPELPPLRQRLAAVTQAGWTAKTTPLMPSLVTRHYAQVLGDGGLVAADAGTAGYWVARTFATTRLGSALVPAAPIAGWAAACVLVARLASPLRPALAVVDGGPDERTRAVVAAAQRLGVSIGLEEWDEAEEPSDAADHLARLADLVHGGLGTVSATLSTDPRQLDEMIGVAGPVRAWTGDETISRTAAT